MTVLIVGALSWAGLFGVLMLIMMLDKSPPQNTWADPDDWFVEKEDT